VVVVVQEAEAEAGMAQQAEEAEVVVPVGGYSLSSPILFPVVLVLP
jgi:hypothetical protein